LFLEALLSSDNDHDKVEAADSSESRACCP
jgi:hypothetical protein